MLQLNHPCFPSPHRQYVVTMHRGSCGLYCDQTCTCNLPNGMISRSGARSPRRDCLHSLRPIPHQHDVIKATKDKNKQEIQNTKTPGLRCQNHTCWTISPVWTLRWGGGVLGTWGHGCCKYVEQCVPACPWECPRGSHPICPGSRLISGAEVEAVPSRTHVEHISFPFHSQTLSVLLSFFLHTLTHTHTHTQVER